jgi:hypothetical protein
MGTSQNMTPKNNNVVRTVHIILLGILYILTTYGAISSKCLDVYSLLPLMAVNLLFCKLLAPHWTDHLLIIALCSVLLILHLYVTWQYEEESNLKHSEELFFLQGLLLSAAVGMSS